MKSPCYKCNDRFVNESTRCHEMCIKYIAYRKEYDYYKRKEAERKISDSFIIECILRSNNKSAKFKTKGFHRSTSNDKK